MEFRYKTPQDQALELALITLENLIKEDIKSSSVLRSCFAISSLIGDQESKQWIGLELYGYDPKEEVPNYRKFRDFSKGNFEVRDSVHRIENFVKKGEGINIWKENVNFNLEPEWGYKVLSDIIDKCLSFVLDVITKLQYSGRMNSIIQNLQNEVNEKIIKIDKEIEGEIQSISFNLQSKTYESSSKVAHSCRRILKILADTVFPPQDEKYKSVSSGKEFLVKDNHYMNRLLAFLDKNKKDKIIEKEIEYLAPIFDELIEFAGEGVHAEINKFEAEKIFIHTYLIMSEVLRVVGIN